MAEMTQRMGSSPFTRAARGRATALLYGATALASAACLSPQSGYATTPAAPISFARCKDVDLPPAIAERAECGTMMVEQDRGQPDGHTLSLPVLRVASLAKLKGEPVFVLNGGPGSPNIGRITPLPLLSAEHDIYYVGYRGADGTGALRCPEYQRPLAAGKLFDAAALEKIALAGKACSARLKAAGTDPVHYSMFDVIEDLEAVRTAIGAQKINLFSISYGTRLAQFYARQHPSSIARSAMFGANPPGHFVFRAYTNDRVLDRLTVLCAADSGCSSRTRNLGDTLRASLKAGGRPGKPAIDSARTQLALFQMLYGRKTTALYVDAAIDAENGNPERLAQTASLIDEALQGIVYGDLFSKASTDLGHYPALLPTFAATDNSMGSPFDMFFMAASKYWPIGPMPAGFDRAAYDPTPTLVVNGDIDVSTPLLFIQAELMPYLPNGKLVVLKDYGHLDFVRQLAGLDAMVTQFYADGTVDTSFLKDDPYRFEP